jgi:hypothetical protein
MKEYEITHPRKVVVPKTTQFKPTREPFDRITDFDDLPAPTMIIVHIDEEMKTHEFLKKEFAPTATEDSA